METKHGFPTEKWVGFQKFENFDELKNSVSRRFKTLQKWNKGAVKTISKMFVSHDDYFTIRKVCSFFFAIINSIIFIV